MKNITISLNDLLSFWGGITGTASIIIAYLVYRNDRVNIKVDVMPNTFVTGNAYPYKPDVTYTTIKVSNRGKRTVYINSAGYGFLKKDGSCILGESFKRPQEKLTEGSSTSYLTPKDGLDFSEINYFFATDAAGRIYKHYIAPFYKRFFYSFLHITHILRKESVSPGLKK